MSYIKLIGDIMDYETYKLKSKHKKKKLKKESNQWIHYVNKFLVVVLITIITLILLKSSSHFKTKFYKYIYEDNISFASINSLYQKYFGSPIPFSHLLEEKTTPTFNETLTYLDKKDYLDGVELSVASNYLVPNLESGMVIFVGEKENLGKTVIIEQVNGVEVWYSNLSEVNVQIYDYLEKGSLVGEVTDQTLYLTFKKDGEVLNYEDYI